MGKGPGIGFTPLTMYGTHVQWTDMPLAETPLLGITCRMRIRTEGFTQCCFGLEVVAAGAAAAVMRSQYSLDLTGATAFVAFVGTDISIAAGGTFITPWANLPTAARDREILLQVAGQGGDAVADPVVARIWIGLR